MTDEQLQEFSFRPITREDLALIHEWLLRPHVAQWWDSPASLAEVEEEFGSSIDGTGTTTVFIALREQVPMGLIQSYVVMGSGDGWWEDERDPGARGIDQFLADADQLNRGLGTAMVRAFLKRLFSDPAVTVVQADPRPDNHRAIRCYAKLGFTAVGEVATPDGPALLMRCRRADLTDAASA
jgi:RimJ/RimL family protein N-acetyltransferase